ncbi:MAG TPA: DUF697 domain-containing protein [Thermoanaerobaculia bacterium]|nr:DUF697 domain-containing protein [Thermoanaerobaculia bacterium]
MNDREYQAHKLVSRYAMWSAGAGFIPMPAVDMAALLGVQLRMLSRLAQLYEVPFSQERAKSTVAALVGTIMPDTLAKGSIGSFIKAIPLLGTLVGMVAMPAFAAASTFALGRVFQRHFAAGGNLLDFNPEEEKEYFREQLEEGRQAVGGRTAKPPRAGAPAEKPATT